MRNKKLVSGSIAAIPTISVVTADPSCREAKSPYHVLWHGRTWSRKRTRRPNYYHNKFSLAAKFYNGHL
jgi:hypothetical protein